MSEKRILSKAFLKPIVSYSRTNGGFEELAAPEITDIDLCDISRNRFTVCKLDETALRKRLCKSPHVVDNYRVVRSIQEPIEKMHKVYVPHKCRQTFLNMPYEDAETAEDVLSYALNDQAIRYVELTQEEVAYCMSRVPIIIIDEQEVVWMNYRGLFRPTTKPIGGLMSDVESGFEDKFYTSIYYRYPAILALEHENQFQETLKKIRRIGYFTNDFDYLIGGRGRMEFADDPWILERFNKRCKLIIEADDLKRKFSHMRCSLIKGRSKVFYKERRITKKNFEEIVFRNAGEANVADGWVSVVLGMVKSALTSSLNLLGLEDSLKRVVEAVKGPMEKAIDFVKAKKGTIRIFVALLVSAIVGAILWYLRNYKSVMIIGSLVVAPLLVWAVSKYGLKLTSEDVISAGKMLVPSTSRILKRNDAVVIEDSEHRSDDVFESCENSDMCEADDDYLTIVDAINAENESSSEADVIRNVKKQSDSENNSSGIVGIFTSVFGNNTSFNQLGSICRNYCAIDKGIQTIMARVTGFMDYVAVRLRGTALFGHDNLGSLLGAAKNQVRETIELIEKMESPSVESGVTKFDYFLSQGKTEVYFIVVRSIQGSLSSLLELNSRDASPLIHYMNMKLKMFQDKGSCKGVPTLDDTGQVAPVVVLMKGKSGYGKSSIRDKLMGSVFNRIHEMGIPLTYNPKKDIWVKPKNQTYWDGYQCQKVVVMDDFFQIQDATEKITEVKDLFTICEGQRSSLNYASIADKGIRTFNSPFVYISTNMQDFTTTTQTLQVTALRRRFDINVTIMSKFVNEYDPIFRLEFLKLRDDRIEMVGSQMLSLHHLAGVIARFYLAKMRHFKNTMQIPTCVKYSEDESSLLDKLANCANLYTDESGKSDRFELLDQAAKESRHKSYMHNAGFKKKEGTSVLAPPPVALRVASDQMASELLEEASQMQEQDMLNFQDTHVQRNSNVIAEAGSWMPIVTILLLASLLVNYWLDKSKSAYNVCKSFLMSEDPEGCNLGNCVQKVKDVATGASMRSILSKCRVAGSLVAVFVVVLVLIAVVTAINKVAELIAVIVNAAMNLAYSVKKFFTKKEIVTSNATANGSFDVKSTRNLRGKLPTKHEHLIRQGNALSKPVANIDKLNSIPEVEQSMSSCLLCQASIINATLCKECEAIPDNKPAYCAFTDKIGKNIRRMLIKLKDNTRLSTYGLMLRDDYVLFNWHAIENDPEIVLLQSGNTYLEVNRIVSDIEKDLAVGRVLSCQLAADILRFIPETETVTGNVVRLGLSSESHGSILGITSLCAEGSDTPNKFLRIDRITGAVGDCGTPIVQTNRKDSKVLLGIHGASGVTSKHKFAIPLIRSQIEELITRCGVLQEHVFMNAGTTVEDGFLSDVTSREIPAKFVTTLFSKTQIIQSFAYFSPMPYETVMDLPMARSIEEKKVMLQKNLEPLKEKFFPPITSEEEQKVEFDLLTKLNKENSGDWCNNRRMLTLKEAILGKDDVSGLKFSHFERLNPMTSSGFCFKEGLVGKKDYIQMEPYHVLPELEELVNERIESGRKGIGKPSVWFAALKDEKLPAEKVNNGKARLFTVGMLDFNIVTRMLFAAFVAFCHETHAFNPVSVGLDIFCDAEVNIMVKRLKRFPNIIAGDYRKWDKRLPYRVGMAMVNLVNMWYGGKDEKLREVVGEGIFGGSILVGKEIFEPKKGMPSGTPITAVGNSICNSLIIRMCYNRIVANEDMPFDEHVEEFYYGDDHLVSVSNAAADCGFNMINLARVLKNVFGMEYTDISKGEVQSKFTDWTDVSYLKAYFEYNHRTRTWRALYPIESIHEYVLWTHTNNDIQAFQNTVDNALHAMSKHGRKRFDEFRDKMISVCINNSIVFRDWWTVSESNF